MNLRLESSAFEPDGRIPRKYTCDGGNVSPPLRWSGVPAAAEALMLVCADPDAPSGTFYHWAVFNLPPDVTELEEGSGTEERAGGSLRMAINDFGKPFYGGPCPPRGHGEHHYHFRLGALSRPLAASGRVTCADILRLAGAHEIAFAELVGLYGR